jgi:glycosyltransferase involved in cell wall biosynthesis
VIPSAVDTDLFRPRSTDLKRQLGFADGDVVIGYVGTIDASRKLGIFLEHFEELLQHNDRLRLVLVGAGNDRQRLEDYANARKLGSAIRFLGPVPHEDVPEYISMFDYGLCHLPQNSVYNHSFPLKILEYLSCCVPVLASDLEAHDEISQSLDGVYVYANVRDLMTLVAKGTRRKIVQDLEAFSWHVIARRYMDLYRSLVTMDSR